jgi:hypothetical protein
MRSSFPKIREYRIGSYRRQLALSAAVAPAAAGVFLFNGLVLIGSTSSRS